MNITDFEQSQEAIVSQMGTPANPVDWSRPDVWITERLTGKDRKVALHIWEKSGHKVNPRYGGGELALARTYLLLAEQNGKYALTPRGRKFLQGNPQVLRELDEEEGVASLLIALATLETAKRSELLPVWVRLLSPGGESRTESTMQSKMYDRLNNTMARKLVLRDGQRYELTAAGRRYAEQLQPQHNSLARQLDVLAREFRKQQRERLRTALGTMHPYRFEQLIGKLLEAMDYTDVVVTKQSGDKGIDVVATAKFGITTVKEVVQVKRVAGSTGAPVINQLRGSLHTQNAIKGMVITLGTFTSGAKDMAFPMNAAPITLIDGETLLDLLLEYRIGVNPTALTLLEIDEEFFADQAPDQDEEAASA